MTQRLDATKWLWCLLAMLAGPTWRSVGSVSVRTPPQNPSVIETQAKFFQDFFSVQLSPYKIEFGHVCEDPNTWEQRYEKKDFKNHRDMGKVRWGDKQGGYGEHYWDLNHAGHGNDHGSDEYGGSSDDGSYNHDLDHAHEGDDVHDSHETYDEPNGQLPSYGTEEYDSEKAIKYDESGRAKRAHPRIKNERKLTRKDETYQEPQKVKSQKFIRKTEELLQAGPTQQVEKYSNEKLSQDSDPKPERKRQQRQQKHIQGSLSNSDQQKSQNNQPNEESYHQEQQQQQPQQQQQQFDSERQTDKQFVPYELGAGIRHYHQPELRAVTSVPRLFLEPTTGHVVDRATGQAYVLQPIAINNYN